MYVLTYSFDITASERKLSLYNHKYGLDIKVCNPVAQVQFYKLLDTFTKIYKKGREL